MVGAASPILQFLTQHVNMGTTGNTKSLRAMISQACVQRSEAKKIGGTQGACSTSNATDTLDVCGDAGWLGFASNRAAAIGMTGKIKSQRETA